MKTRYYPSPEEKESALDAFCNPEQMTNRISELESALRELLSQPLSVLASVPKHERGCTVYLDRSTIEEAVKALENESEETQCLIP